VALALSMLAEYRCIGVICSQTPGVNCHVTPVNRRRAGKLTGTNGDVIELHNII
jgi:hypothetical protein